MRRLALTLALVLVPSFAWADAPSITVKAPATVRPGEVFYLDASESVSDDPIEWTLNNKPSLFKTFDDGPRKGVLSAAVGLSAGTTMRFVAVASGVPPGGAKPKYAVFVWDVKVVDADPVPPAPTPVPPKPDPTPEPPAPVPDDAPEVTGKMRVIFLYEKSENLPASKYAVIYSPEVEQYLSTHCVTDEDGRPAWRVWDKDVRTDKSSASWKAALEKAKATPGPLPKMVVFKSLDKPPNAYQIDKDVNGTLDILKLYGGR